MIGRDWSRSPEKGMINQLYISKLTNDQIIKYINNKNIGIIREKQINICNNTRITSQTRLKRRIEKDKRKG
jgi:hypothetical protein